MVEFAQDGKAARMFDLYPRGRDGVIIANSVEVTDAARPHFEAAPLSDPDDGRPRHHNIGCWLHRLIGRS
jgi:hypothetical protein